MKTDLENHIKRKINFGAQILTVPQKFPQSKLLIAIGC